MVAFSLSRTVSILVALVHVAVVTAAPMFDASFSTLDDTARSFLARRATISSAPHFVIYSDKYIAGLTGPPDASLVEGYNVFAMSFLLLSGPADKALEWTQLTDDQRSSVLSQYHDAGISIVVSAFGSTNEPTTSGADPVATANTMAQWVIQYGLDGIDVDYEDLDAMNAGTGAAEQWLITFTQTLRSQLPQGQYILTHAPIAPWFQPNGRWGGGGYLEVDQPVGSLIDWYNIQFYNQGQNEYTDCNGLLTASSSSWPETALFQIAANGVDLSKLVIGKPGILSDEQSGGYIDPGTLATCVGQAVSQGWNAGVMVWEYPDADASWIQTVRGSTFPLGGDGGGSPTTPLPSGPTTTITTTTTASSPTSTPPSGSGSCAGVAAWQSDIAYTGGQEVTYNSQLWTAKWWSEGDVPGGAAGDWTDDGSC